MKRNFKKLGLVLMLSALTISVSCSDDSNSESNTIASIASKNAEFSTLVTALNKTGLTATLNGSGNFTVFAPTNQAFSTFLSANGFSSLDDVPVAVLKEVLLNHVVNDELFSNELTTGYVKSLGKGSASSTNTLSLFINTASGVKINGVSNVTAADIDASNGVIHKVDAVVGLPTILTHAVANPNFTSLVAALTRSDQADQNFVGILSGTASSPFTVFAPTNTAFSSLLTEFGWSSLGDVPETVLEKTLKYHVVAGSNILASGIPSTATNITTFQGQTFSINAIGGAKIIDANNRTSNIIATDVQCANGVIHVIDKVIVPNLN
ncbi:MAG TPA: fasciclin domain-containing protein [Flavobacterium lutivivi]|nr:fasciclin domain-containing protein [Flavobacterium lutivivi]